MLFAGIDCDEEGRKILEASRHLFLDARDQVDFHFMIHQRNALKTPDFMAKFEEDLLARKYAQLQETADFASLDPHRSFIPLRKYAPDELDPASFQKLLNDPRSPPVVIRGLTADSVAVRNWTHEYLMGSFGDVSVVALEFDKNGSYQAAEQDGDNLTLREIIRAQLGSGGKNSYYVNNSAQIFNEFPELIDDIGGAKVLDLFQGHSVNTFSQLFVGNVKTWGTNWHQGNDLSCALMINGVKRWYFMDPRLVYVLRPYLNGPNGMMTKGEVRHSIDFHLLHDPLYAYAPKFVLDLEPGDVLFFTKYWPHAVMNVSPFQIMANMRMTEVSMEALKKGTSTANLAPVFDNILNSDPDFIRFKFEIYQGLGKRKKEIGDSHYFGSYASIRKK